MLAGSIKSPEEYLSHSALVLEESGVLEIYPKIKTYYQELRAQFVKIYNTITFPFFEKLGRLLTIDAQIQILLELTEITEQHLVNELGMSEEEIIQMIRHDQKYFYRELTGGTTTEKPKWALIYLSEE